MKTAPQRIRLHEGTTQETLEKIFVAQARRELLLNTPVNVGRFFRYGVLFVLFPGMVMGYRIGLSTALGLCAALLSFLVCGRTTWADSLAKYWLGCGLIVWLCVTLHTVRQALKLYRERMGVRRATTAASEPAGTATVAPSELQVVRREVAAGLRLEATVHAVRQGVYAFLLSLTHCGQGRLLVPEHVGVCCVHAETKANTIRAVILYRLAPGDHTLCWYYMGDDGQGVRMHLQSICAPDDGPGLSSFDPLPRQETVG